MPSEILKGPFTPVPSQPQSASSFVGTETRQQTLLSELLEILKGPYTWFQALPAAVHEQLRWLRDQVGDMSVLQEILKGPTLGFSPSSHSQGPVQPAQGPGGRHTDPCLQRQVCRLQSWLWKLKQPWAQFQPFSAIVQGQSYPFRDSLSDKAIGPCLRSQLWTLKQALVSLPPY